MSQTFEHLIVDVTEGIARITLNRPERRNALSLAMMRQLISCIRGLGADGSVRVLILAAKGPVFSSGHDLNELFGRSIGEYRELFDTCVELMTVIEHISQPVIAEVDGLATAAGCQLVATCDLVVASEHARFATPGVRIGLFCSTPMVALSRAIGRKRALEMLLTGTQIDAEKASAWGLVNRVAKSEALCRETLGLAREIAEASGLTIGIGKQAFYAQIDLDETQAYRHTKEVMSLNALADDAQEGIGAFLEKRKPTWKGR
ncbi:MAG: enoyl-CoA hydratase [Acidobacteriota bacterium]